MPKNYEKENDDYYDDPAEQWMNKPPETFKEIVVRSINRCSQEWGKDLKKGGNYTINNLPVYVKDQRDTNINETKTLYDLLFTYFDKEATDKFKEIEKKINKVTDFKKELIEEYKGQIKGQNKFKQAYDLAEDKGKEYVLNLYREMFRELISLFHRQRELSKTRTVVD